MLSFSGSDFATDESHARKSGRFDSVSAPREYQVM